MNLNPFEAAYEALTAVRNSLYDRGSLFSYRPSTLVVSIGNLTAGGTGKTPLAMYVTALLRTSCRPVVLAKGYKGKRKGPWVVTATDRARDVGDEPLLFARHTGCPVVISHNKTEGARFIEQEDLGDVIVLDDGFQHRRLARDVDVVCVDVSSKQAVRDFIRGRLLPAGRFRENRDKGIARANMVVLSHRRPSRGDIDLRELCRLIPEGMPVFESFYTTPLPPQSLASDSSIAPCPVLAVSGIANAGGFHDSLRSLGFTVAEAFTWADHDRSFEKKLTALRAKYDLPIVCTEKDAVRLSPSEMERVGEVYMLPVGIVVTSFGEKEPSCSFSDCLINLLTARKSNCDAPL